MSTSGGHCDAFGGYHEYIRDVQYIGGYHGGYHEYIRGCSVTLGDVMMHVGQQAGKNLSISIKTPDVLMISPMY